MLNGNTITVVIPVACYDDAVGVRVRAVICGIQFSDGSGIKAVSGSLRPCSTFQMVAEGRDDDGMSCILQNAAGSTEPA